MDRSWTEETFKDAALSLAADTTCPLDDVLGLCGTSSFVESSRVVLDTFTFSIDDWSDLHAVSELLSDYTKPESVESSSPITGEHLKCAPTPTEARDSIKSTPTHTKKKRNLFAWTEKKPRKRAKAEILKLRGEATATYKPQDNVKIHVAQFDTSSHTLESLSLATKTLNEAAAELQMLQRSQELNILLRSALIEKIQVRQAFEAQLQQHPMLQAYNFELLNEYLSTAVDSEDREHCDSPREELDEKLLNDLERQRRNRITDRVLKEICTPPGPTSSSSSRSAHTNSDAVYDPVIKQETKRSEAWNLQALR